MDLLVRTPQEMKWRLEEGDTFLTVIVRKGKVLYEKVDSRRTRIEKTSTEQSDSRASLGEPPGLSRRDKPASSPGLETAA